MTTRLVAGTGLRPRAKGCAVVGGKRAAQLPDALDLRVAELVGQGADRIAERLGVAAGDVAASLARLRLAGAVTDAPTPAGPPRVVRFFERTVGAEQAATALDRLTSATVRVLGDGDLVAAIADGLRASGVGVASTSDEPVALVIGAPAEPTETPTLPVAVTAEGVVVGPLCSVDGGRCPHCGGAPAAERGAQADAITTRVAVALAVGEAVRHLSGTGRCRTAGGTVTVRGVEQSFRAVARDPACVHCGVPGAPAEEYQWFQAVDVPLKANWTHPVLPVKVHRADGLITVIPQPDGRTDSTRRQLWGGAVGAAADVFAPRGSRGVPAPTIGGTTLLNAFICGTVDGAAVACYLDRRRGAAVPVLAPPSAASANPRVVIAASIARAEKQFGRRAELTVHQDTGFALAELRRALARKGFDTIVHDDATPELLTGLGFDPARDVLTAVVEITAGAQARRVTPRQSTGVDMLTELLADAAPPDVPGYVRCHGVDGVADGLHRIGARLTPVSASTERLDAALRLRGMAPDAVAVFGMDLARWRPVGPAVRAQAEAAYHVHRAAADRGQSSLLLTDLPSTALDPDGRGWRTTWRSFAAVALGGDLPAPVPGVVSW